MKKLCVLLALLAPISNATENEGLKGTWKAGYTKVDVDGMNTDFTGVSVGYERDKWYGYYSQTSTDILGIDFDFNVFSVGYKHVFNKDEEESNKQNNFYGKLGLAHKKIEAAVPNTGLKISDSETKLAYAIGYEVLRKDKLGLFAELAKEDKDAKTFRFGATFGF